MRPAMLGNSDLRAIWLAYLASRMLAAHPNSSSLLAPLLAIGATSLLGPIVAPTAILFRLLKFRLILPIDAGCYGWLTHERRAQHDR